MEEVQTDNVEVIGSDLIYAAGYFDGEGCITILKCHDISPTLRITIVSTNKAVLALFGRLFHQRVYEVEHSKYARLHQKSKARLFRWSISGARAAETLRDIEPLLIAKRQQAQLALSVNWSSGIVEGREQVIAQRWTVKEQLSKLKRIEKGEVPENCPTKRGD